MVMLARSEKIWLSTLVPSSHPEFLNFAPSLTEKCNYISAGYPRKVRGNKVKLNFSEVKCFFLFSSKY